MRVIANQWLNRKFESKRDVESAMLWLGQNKTGLFFCTPRGNSNLEYGLQFWLTHADDVFLVHMMAAPVVQIRTFTAEQFAAHLTTMLAWQTQS